MHRTQSVRRLNCWWTIGKEQGCVWKDYCTAIAPTRQAGSVPTRIYKRDQDDRIENDPGTNWSASSVCFLSALQRGPGNQHIQKEARSAITRTWWYICNRVHLPALRRATEALGVFSEMVCLPLIVERQFLYHAEKVRKRALVSMTCSVYSTSGAAISDLTPQTATSCRM